MPRKGSWTPNRYELLPDGQTALIYLTKGQTTLIDAADLARVLTRRWHISVTNQFTARSLSHGQRITLHRFLLEARPDQQVDHRNHNSLDNRRANLRLATPEQNGANRRVQRKPKTSRYKGVSTVPELKPWRAKIACRGQTYSKIFRTEDEAAEWYNLRAREFFGEFAHLNVIADGAGCA